MSDLKKLIRREIQSAAIQGRIRGTVLTIPVQRVFDVSGGTAPTYVCDVDIGAAQILRDVPVKINGPKARFYARPGFAVYLDRNAQGRYQVVAPADRATQQGSVTEIDEETGLESDGGNIGNRLVQEVYDYYKGITPESFFDPAADPDTLLWLRSYDRASGAPDHLVVISDVDGSQVLRFDAIAPSLISAYSLGSSSNPLYRKFDALFTVTQRSSVDFDGVDDGLILDANVVEDSAGQLSIFVLLNKDAVGAGDDCALELGNFRILSRISAADRWGLEVGAGVEDSGGTIGTSFTLIEIIASAYSNLALYQDGVSLGSIATGAGGLGLSSSSIGYSAAAAAGSHDGRIAEVLVIDRTVSTADRLAIEAYFNQTAFVAFSRYNDGVNGYPKSTVLDANGDPI